MVFREYSFLHIVSHFSSPEESSWTPSFWSLVFFFTFKLCKSLSNDSTKFDLGFDCHCHLGHKIVTNILDKKNFVIKNNTFHHVYHHLINIFTWREQLEVQGWILSKWFVPKFWVKSLLFCFGSTSQKCILLITMFYDQCWCERPLFRPNFEEMDPRN